MITNRTQKPPRLKCTKCDASFRQETLRPQGIAECDGCAQKHQQYIFPAFTKRLGEDARADTAPLEGEWTCYYFPDRRATSICDDCGRHISEFLKVSIGSHVTCLTCLDGKSSDDDDPRVDVRNIAYDNRVLALGVVPTVSIIGLWASFLTIPATLFFVIKDWGRCNTASVLPMKRWKYYVAIAFGVMPMVAIVPPQVANFKAAAERGKAIRLQQEAERNGEFSDVNFENIDFNDL